MSQADLRAVEQKVFRVSIDHGLWDIYLGLMVVAMGVSALLDDLGKGDSSLWFIGLMLIAMTFFFASRRFIVEPRLGKVRFGARRKANLRIIAGLIGLAVLVGLALWWVSASALGIPGSSLLPIVLWVVMSLGCFGVAAYLLGFPRLYLYGFLFALVFVTLELIKAGALRTLPTIAAGAVILTIGLVLFVHFLQKFPVPVIPQEENHEAHGA